MRNVLASLLLGFAGFGMGMLAERYVTAVPEWLWRSIALASLVGGVAGAAMTDGGQQFLRTTKPLGVATWFALVFAGLGVAIYLWILRPILVLPRVGFVGTVSIGDFPPGASIGGIAWSNRFSFLEVTFASELESENFNVVIRPDVAVAEAKAISALPDLAVFPVGVPTQTPELTWKDGKRRAVPLVLVASTHGYHVRCKLLPAKTLVKIVFATVTVVPPQQPASPTPKHNFGLDDRNYWQLLTYPNGSRDWYGHPPDSQGRIEEIYEATRVLAKSFNVEGSFQIDGTAWPIKQDVAVTDQVGDALKQGKP
jgi:hypothetical protein